MQAIERLCASQIEWKSFYPLLAAIVTDYVCYIVVSDPRHIFDGDMPTAFTSERVFVFVREQTYVRNVSTFLAHKPTTSR
jgi:hypothetical protein